MKFRSIKGTKDILPDETLQWQFVERQIHDVMQRYLYREIRTPLFESTALFARSIGELTDIVSKEMYTFTDRSNESLTLKPEGTASVLRAYIQHNLDQAAPLTKLYYLGPMFRQERPQAGRLRQFHQYGAEVIGSDDPFLDAEIISLSVQILDELDLQDQVLAINSVGCPTCRPKYRKELVRYLSTMADKLSKESQARLAENPLRILDSKDKGDQEATAGAPLMKDQLCDECARHFERTQSLLKKLGIEFVINGRLVRGLDYYTKTAFEITSSSLGSQDALAGGGRYDLLIEELGGKATPAVGFAAGIERVLIAMLKKKPARTSPGPSLYIVALDDASRLWSFATLHTLRSQGHQVEMDFLGRSIKAQLREANRLKARFAVVIGEEERTSGSCKLKEMETGKERIVSLDQIHQFIS